jgi:hypothetical protein
MSSTIKQQPFSPVSYNSFSNDFYNRQQSTSPTINNIPESSSTSTLIPPSTTNGGGRGWYINTQGIKYSSVSMIFQLFVYLKKYLIHICFSFVCILK